ncbi:Hsp70 family protein [Parabacteroides segnis]|uniref:Hsp70 family protein n=1 Tax=Parabacteroides segnis TaxID=2763058 RepID=UPI0035181582
MSHPIGIDLGTTYSAIAKWEVKPAHTGPYVYNNPTENVSGGSSTLASKVYFTDASSYDKPVVGTPAINKGVIKPNLFFSAFKRGMDDNAVIERDGGFEITPVELSAIILKKLLKTVEDEEAPGTFVPEGVVVSVPAYFNEKQNLHTVEAIKLALKNSFESRNGYSEDLFIRLIQEPVAAGLDYVFEHPNDIQHEKIVIFDLGGGTFDVTIFEVNNDLKKREIVFKTLATDGDDRLGGEDFDHTLSTYIVDDEGFSDSEISSSSKSLFHERCTALKCDLSITESAEIMVPYIIGQQALEKVVQRKEFEQCMIGEKGDKIDYISDIKDRLDRAFGKAGIGVGEIGRCILIGGSSKIPCVRSILEKIFSSGKVINGNIGEGVARGASLIAAYELDKRAINQGEKPKYMSKWDKIEILENTAHALGIKTNKGYSKIIEQNTATPARGVKTFTPTMLSQDGLTALVPSIDVYQRGGRVWTHVGAVDMPTIYSHGRQPRNILIKVEFIAESTQIVSKITVDQGNEDQTNLIVTKTLSLSGTAK